MSEHQYYEFQAIDRRLDDADRQALRVFSSRATITARAFSNHYEWGDFKGDPASFMDRWFDLHLYLANWGTRRLMIRVPHHLIDMAALEAIVGESDCVTTRRSEGNLILDIVRDELEPYADEVWPYGEDEDSDWLAALSPLRGDLMAGDLRLFYLLWLIAVEYDEIEPEAAEPLPGIGPLTDALDVFATFFCIDPDLVAAAAERRAESEPVSDDAIRAFLATLSEGERLDRLTRVARGDPHVAAELQSEIRLRLASKTSSAPMRTARELRSRAVDIRKAREKAHAEEQARARRQKAEAEAKARRERLDAILRRGQDVWREIDFEIERRNASGYGNAVDLLGSLKTLHEESGTSGEFKERIEAIRERHGRKGRFIERLDELKI